MNHDHELSRADCILFATQALRLPDLQEPSYLRSVSLFLVIVWVWTDLLGRKSGSFTAQIHFLQILSYQ